MDERSSSAQTGARWPAGWGARKGGLVVSVAVHAVVLGLWLHEPAPGQRPRAEAHRPRAATTVRLYSPQAPSFNTSARTARVVDSPAPTFREVKTVPIAALPNALGASVVQAPAMPAAEAQATPPARAAFAGLFAPILSTPLGRSAWRRAAPAAEVLPQALDPQVQREQALLVLRMSLLGRLNDLAGRLSASGQDLHCDITIDGPRRLAEVRCADPADQGAPWSALQGLLVAGAVPPEVASLCLRLVGAQVASAPCADATHTPSSEHR